MSREAMQLALGALESDPISHAGLVSRKQAITALRQALVDADDTLQKRVDETSKAEYEWVRLTDEEKIELWNKHENHWRFEDNLMAFTRAIEQALKEKNT